MLSRTTHSSWSNTTCANDGKVVEYDSNGGNMAEEGGDEHESATENETHCENCPPIGMCKSCGCVGSSE